ncbi:MULTISPECIES: class I SAM-dependent methyltransferase [Sphingobium]|uniref:3-demethylubiquinone-9 3-methyltransferase n=2 Tax=Sphingobium cupriresistens TaxID=1132417 RepID=A0A0J7Y366_9SPHN|nr:MULTISPECIES: class I SAM-dependent methyltransferase [Sphingobium]KMS58127.1 3-demethylubiquinone-9 3-methyltransferase [Sphingobium cupriresistens LL01]MBJ7376904.1 class I SAM-dependent methyltransferase [Sphingobium sp.]RYM12316.1 class I SAM-dependent methyltransferase [Sphingobium cupriresistens]WCP14964.1 Ubiquinone biosynthesis O-methyltransferase, mitochondrial [Sphingobium sp. AntQ-1]
MPKAGELAYLANLGDGGREHSLEKPFSDPSCGINLASIGFMMTLLPQPPARILDLGCGGGWTSTFFAKRGYDVIGQDIAPDMIEVARENCARHGLEQRLSFTCSDFEALDMDNQFDAAIFFDSLHHAEDELLAIRSAWRALKPGGVLITHEPGDGHATSPDSIAAMQVYGVTERDMPPRLIMQRGAEVGFKDFRVVPLPQYLHYLFYEPRTYPKRLWSKRRWTMTKRVLKLLFDPDPGAGAIVIMTK